MDLTTSQLIQAALLAVLVGFTKTGISGMGAVIVPWMAALFGAKESTGILLPLLILGDCFAVARYRRHADWRVIGRLLPWILPGLLLGWGALRILDNRTLAPLFGGLILVLIGVKLLLDRGEDWVDAHLPHRRWFSAFIGLTAGFTTMAGNLAGGVMSIYFLSMGMRKHAFMGTGAWYFFMLNTVKVPFSANLGLITGETLLLNLKLAPAVVAGALLGYKVFGLVPQKWFDRIIVVVTAASAVRLFFM